MSTEPDRTGPKMENEQIGACLLPTKFLRIEEMKLINKITGDVIAVDKKKMRLRRMQKRVFAWSEALKDELNVVGYENRLVMVTLTYEKVEDWKAGHIRAFMQVVRMMLKSRLLAYAWCAEMQERGAVHYHVLLLVKRGTRIDKPDQAGWWVHGSTRIETARSQFYILKYTGKEHQKMGNFPKGLRLFAVWISPRILKGLERWYFRISTWPRWLLNASREKLNLVGEPFGRLAGGGWFIGEEVFKSPWIVEF